MIEFKLVYFETLALAVQKLANYDLHLCQVLPSLERT